MEMSDFACDNKKSFIGTKIHVLTRISKRNSLKSIYPVVDTRYI